MTLEAPIIALTSAVAGSGDLGFSFTSDPGFPLAETTFFVMDPATSAVVATFPGNLPPTVILSGINETQTYVVSAVSYDAGTAQISAPSLPVVIEPFTWNGGIKTIIHATPFPEARTYRLENGNGVVLVDHPYPVFVDSTVYSTEEEAANETYHVFAEAPRNTATQTIVRRYRTRKSLCLVTGEALEPNGDPAVGRPTPVNFRMMQGMVPDTNKPRARVMPQRTFIQDFQIEAWPNFLGQWGAYLMSGAVMWFESASHRLEFMVPFASTANILDIPHVVRSLRPKRT